MTEGKTLWRCGAAALIWRIMITAASVYGLAVMLLRGSSQMFCYFTIQSNLLALLLFAVLTVGTARSLSRRDAPGEVYHVREWLQLGVVYFIQITFLVYASMLSGSGFAMGNSPLTVSNTLLHYGVPLAALLDWLLFMPHGRVRVRHTALWLVYPAAYVVFSFIRAELGAPFGGGSRFPYFFMDADLLGLHLLWVCPLFFAGFFALGLALTAVDRALGRSGAR